MTMTSKLNNPPTQTLNELRAEIIAEAGEALYGHFWRVQLSTALGYASTCSTLRRWLDGETPVPKAIPGAIHVLLTRSERELTTLIAKIDVQLAEQLEKPIEGHFETTRNRENLKNLETAGLLLFGEMWEKALATSLGYSRWGVRAWKIGKRHTPHELPWLLRRVLHQRSGVVRSLLPRIEQLLPTDKI